MSEYFPDTVDYQTEHTRPEMQGAIDSCTRFGAVHFVENVAHRSGVYEQYSYRYQWYFRATGALSVEGAIKTINTVGLALEEDDPYLIEPDFPWNPIDMDRPPTFAAFMSAKARMWQFEIARVNGQEEIMRALCEGSPLISIRVLPGGAEHCECIIGYDKVNGVKIHGSGSSIYWEPWSSVPHIITQTWRYVKGPWKLQAHPDYIPPAKPTWRGDYLHIPKLTIVGEKIQRFVDVKVYFKDAMYGTPTFDCPEIFDVDAVFWARRETLDLPNLVLGNTTHNRVRLAKPVFDFSKLSGTEV